MKNSVVWNEALDHKERGEGSRINASLNISHESISPQEEGVYLLDYIEEQNDISFGVLGKNEVVNSEILNEVTDISFENSHEISFQSSFDDQFDNMQDEFHFGQPSNGKQMTEYVEGCPTFYDPVAEYMDRFFQMG